MLSTDQISEAMREEGLGAWLFSNFHHGDPISDKLLGIPEAVTNTRPWIYLLPCDGQALKLVHVIEQKILDHLPGDRRIYGTREQFTSGLRAMASQWPEVACNYSAELPAVSHLDHGSASLLRHCGFRLHPAAALIQRVLGGLDQGGIQSHRRAADRLYDVVAEVWERLRRQMRGGEPLWETTVQGWILNLFESAGLVTDSPPIVAVGRNSADPHYSPGAEESARGALLEPGRVLQLDLWAREDTADAVYADISWVGFLDAQVPQNVQTVFGTLVQARELAVRCIGRALEAGQSVSGQEVDREVRAFLEERGHGPHLRHRTGHGIDHEVHGFGVNLDSVEFPDPRRILEGSCFSVEPGLYLEEYGMRSEINVYIAGNRPVVSGRDPQLELLRF